MSGFLKYACALLALSLAMSSASAEEKPGTARFDRATFIVKDMEVSLAFWRDVMQFELLFEPRKLPPLENEYLGWTKEGVLRFARLQSPDGAGIGLMEITQPDFPDLNIGQYPNAHGSVVFVHIAKDIEALHEH